jgi:hypothetical protein
MSMLVLQPSTSTIMFAEKGGRVAVLVKVGASVKAVAVTVDVGIRVAVSLGVAEMGAGVADGVMVRITGVGDKMEGVIVGGGAGKVGMG